MRAHKKRKTLDGYKLTCVTEKLGVLPCAHGGLWCPLITGCKCISSGSILLPMMEVRPSCWALVGIASTHVQH
jgi:hypothetical protein